MDTYSGGNDIRFVARRVTEERKGEDEEKSSYPCSCSTFPLLVFLPSRPSKIAIPFPINYRGKIWLGCLGRVLVLGGMSRTVKSETLPSMNGIIQRDVIRYRLVSRVAVKMSIRL